MEIVIRQEMTKEHWANIVVQGDGCYYFVFLHLHTNSNYDCRDLHWQHRRRDFAGEHPIWGYLSVETTRSIARGDHNRIVGRDLVVDRVWYVPDIHNNQPPIKFPTFWEARRWFVQYDPIPMLVQQLL